MRPVSVGIAYCIARCVQYDESVNVRPVIPGSLVQVLAQIHISIPRIWTPVSGDWIGLAVLGPERTKAAPL